MTRLRTVLSLRSGHFALDADLFTSDEGFVLKLALRFGQVRCTYQSSPTHELNSLLAGLDTLADYIRHRSTQPDAPNIAKLNDAQLAVCLGFPLTRVAMSRIDDCDPHLN